MTREEREKRRRAREATKVWRDANANRPQMRDVDRLLVEAFLRSCPKSAWPTVIAEVRVTLEDAGYDDGRCTALISDRLKRLRDGRVSYVLTKLAARNRVAPPLLLHTQ